mmetsp:Transcript_32300/g.59404  ORF Transcript_32300/g.59404 Transcript_32300/m.59404 type:complete len:104 (-) Transcript_32300:1838-2149(-)
MSGVSRGKSRRVLQVKEAIGRKKSQNRSADLIALTDQFNELKSELKKLVVALKNQHASMEALAKSRAQVSFFLWFVWYVRPWNLHVVLEYVVSSVFVAMLLSV